MENDSLIATVFGYSPQMRILNYLLDFPTNDFTKKEIIQALGMSKQTFYKYFDGLEDTGMVKVSRAIGKAKLYKVDKSSPMIKTITEFERKLSMQIADQEESRMKRPVSGKQGNGRDRRGPQGGAAQGYGGILQEERIHFRTGP